MVQTGLMPVIWRAHKTLCASALVLLAVNLLAFWGGDRILSPRQEALRQSLRSKEDSLRHLRLAEGERDPSDLAVQKQGLDTFREGIPPKSQFSRLIKELYALADEADLSIASVSYDHSRLEGGLLKTTFQFGVGGTYGEIKKFIYLIEQSRRYVAIDAITLVGGEDPAGESVNLRLRLTTYFRAEP